MRVRMAYGRRGLELELPDGASLLEKAPVAPLADPGSALRAALASPRGARPLRELAAGRRNAAIVVSDATRPVPNALLLPPLLDELRAGGLAPEAVSVVVATGLHRPATPAELVEMLGPGLARSLRIVQHDARAPERHLDLGRTRSGLPIRIDRFFCESELRITTGLVEPHLMAGYSGGRKAVCPGLAAAETIRAAHGPALLEGHVGPGIVAGNPLHEALIEVVRRVGVHFSLNVALDRERRVAGVFAGCVEASHAEAMAFVESESLVSLAEPADLVVVSAGGAPLDRTFYQAIKGIATAQGIVRPGGIVLLVAELAEGIGSASFEKCLREAASPEDFERRLLDPEFFAIDQWMVQHLCQAHRRARLLVYAEGLPAETLAELLVEPVASPEAGIAAALAALGPGARVAAIPQGPYVLATVGGRKTPLGWDRPFPP